MPLETGTFIPELDDNNPLGSDNVSLGDDHIRLLKRCVGNSFGAFVGTTGTPKSVTKTEDAINDAAEKSIEDIINARWRFAAGMRLQNNQGLFSRNVGDTADVPLVRLDSGDIVQLGDGTVDVVFSALANVDLLIAGGKVSRFVTPALGTLLVDDRGAVEKKVGFRNPTAIAAGGDRDLNQDDEGRILLCTTNNGDYTAVQLETFTTLRLIVSALNVTLLPGAGVSINLLDGSGAAVPAASGIAIAVNSVVEIVYQTATSVQVFGNGITVI